MKSGKLLALAALLASTAISANSAALPGNAQMDVNFTLPKIDTSMYARPYVAIWIEDQNRRPVRTLELWVGKDEWLKDLRSWWRKVGRNDKALVDGVTSATRPAGHYRFVWDGKDDKGNRVEQGSYTFLAEVVREHGGRNLIRQKIELGTQGFSHRIAATEETGTVTLDYKIN